MAEIDMVTETESATTSLDHVLRKVASDGSMDYSLWPSLLPQVIARIEKIAYTEFPIPTLSTRQPPARPPSPRFLAPIPSSDPAEAAGSSPSSQGTNKENDTPASPRAAAAPADAATLPRPIADMLDEITTVLKRNFQQNPPHTIQRLAELILTPRRHYRGLVAYLHALDRVVHVTSGANIYPLPPAVPDMSAMSLLANGVGGGGVASLSINTNATASAVGSDEALGGALLTPIPWLARRANGGPGSSEDGASDDGAAGSSPLSASDPTAPATQSPSSSAPPHLQRQQPQRGLEGQVRTESTETIEGPNGMGSIETVSVSVNGIPSMSAAALGMAHARGVTQGELLRQEQRAGVVPVSQLARQVQGQQQQLLRSANPLGSSTSAENGPSGMDVDGDDEEPAGNPDHASEGDEEERPAADDDEEVPHARGPQEIGPADTGPMPGGIIGTQPVEMTGINVEAAVGRRASSLSLSQQHASSSNTEDVIPRSPKREATDELGGQSRKRAREENSEPADTKASEDTAADKMDVEGEPEVSNKEQGEGVEHDDVKDAASAAQATTSDTAAAGSHEGSDDSDGENRRKT